MESEASRRGEVGAAERVTIAGDGQMALVLADLLVFKGTPVTLWCPFAQSAGELGRTRRSPRLPGFELPATVAVTPDPGEAFGSATIAVNAIPTQYIRPTWERIVPSLPPGTPIVNVAKGIEIASLRRPSEILRETLARASAGDASGIVAFSGPTIAAELAKRLPAVMVAASESMALSERVQAVFTAPWLRIYTNSDPLGVELAGALKNVIAIAAGIIDGVGLGANAKSALLARGLVEMVRFGAAVGAKPDTFFGVAGVGDLATTCFSPEGRNRSFGEAVGRGEAIAHLLEEGRGTSVVEGAPTAKAVHAWAQRLGVTMPIMEAVYAMVFEGLPPKVAVGELMRRTAGAERVG
jgi:glycerol-3-phosphate dehydrogenase (NAD(P)+)